MAQTITTTDTAEKPRSLPFSPVTTAGLAIAIEEHSSVWVNLINQRRIFDPRLSTEAQLIAAMCRARTDRVLAAAFGGAA
jgi:hypothetical protein